MLNLDTHILLHALNGDLTAKEEKRLEGELWGISAIVLWEISKLSQLGRIEINVDDPDFIDSLQSIHVWPIDLEICRQLKKLDFKSDPADELIAATSIVYRIPLLTRDKKILASKLIPFARAAR